MSITVGIDIGGTTTKIVGITNIGGIINKSNIISPVCVRASDPISSVYGAFGRFTSENGIKIEEISKIMITGVGASSVGSNIYGIPTEKVDEFVSTGKGGLFTSELKEAIVVSMGTGTALVYSKVGETPVYLGGTGIGGGTLVGLSRVILHMEDMDKVAELASSGSLSKVDLAVKDISKDEIPSLVGAATAANFGKISDVATNSDLAAGIFNMVYETIGMMAVFAARRYGIDKIVLTGNLSAFPRASYKYSDMGVMFGADFIIPELSNYATVIGAAMQS